MKIQATLPRFTSCAPTARDRSASPTCLDTMAAVLHARRLPHRLAPFRRAGTHRRRLDDEAGWTDQQQITDFGAMSWAPYEHPSGEYFILASNKLGFENFELFIVDTKGAKEPVRVTYSDGFDGLPVPSPDGKTLAWTSSRSGGSAGQLFLAQWNHEKALEPLRQARPRKPSKKVMMVRCSASWCASLGRIGAPGTPPRKTPRRRRPQRVGTSRRWLPKSSMVG